MHTTDYLKISTDRNAANTIILNNVVPYGQMDMEKKRNNERSLFYSWYYSTAGNKIIRFKKCVIYLKRGYQIKMSHWTESAQIFTDFTDNKYSLKQPIVWGSYKSVIWNDKKIGRILKIDRENSDKIKFKLYA